MNTTMLIKKRSTEMMHEIIEKYGGDDNRDFMRDLQIFRELIQYEDFKAIREKISTFKNFKTL